MDGKGREDCVSGRHFLWPGLESGFQNHRIIEYLGLKGIQLKIIQFQSS